MALFRRKVDYALVVLSYLHHQPQGGCARMIAQRFGLKIAFTAKVLKLLCQVGLVRSQRGQRGGYLLGRPADQISLGELLDLMQEPFELTDCSRAGAKSCELLGTCPVSGALQAVDHRVRRFLHTIRLSDLFEPLGESRCETEQRLQLTLARKV
ncbi:MAG: Rrf2 family transcriptional regulator [Gemmataceae bacterium]